MHDAFPDYGKDFRRRLGIESEQAMELFHQTVSMKSVGNLTDFVRDHMLEPFDAAKAVSDIVAHFEDLTKAHEAVRRAEAQLTALTPLLKDCDAADAVRAEIAALDAQRAALKYYFADLKAGLTGAELTEIAAERAQMQAQRDDLEATLGRLREQETNLRVELAGHGGNRLAEIERQLTDCDAARISRSGKAERFAALLAAADLAPVETAEHFAVRRREITAARDTARQDLAGHQNALTETGVRASALRDEAAEVNAELRSLRERKTNIPKKQLELRAALCRELRIGEDALPFAGELIAVRDSEADWEGAAERLLHGFALSVLVPDEHYRRRVRLDQRPPPERPGGVLPRARAVAGRGSATPARAGHAGRQARWSRTRRSPGGWNTSSAGAPTTRASRRWRSSAGCPARSPRPGR